jgi:hypothetical protein
MEKHQLGLGSEGKIPEVSRRGAEAQRIQKHRCCSLQLLWSSGNISSEIF